MTGSSRAAASRRRVVFAGGAGVAAAALAAACGQAGSGAPPAAQPGAAGRVEFWHIWSSGPSKEWLTQALAALQAKAPRLEVQEAAQDFWTFQQKVTTAAAGGTPPDVTMADSGTAPLRGLSGENGALDGRLARDRVRLADLVEYQAKEVVYGGKTWGLPFRPDTRITFYNKALLQAAGLDPARPPATWDDLWSQSERLTKKGADGKYSQLGFYPTLGNVWFWTLAWTNGAEFVDANNVPTLNTRPALETLEWYLRWAQKYDHAAVTQWNQELSSTPNSNPFFLEKLALTVNTNPFDASIKRYAPSLNWGVGLIPYKTRKASWGAGFDLELPAGSRQPDAAWEWARFLDFDPEVNRQAILITANLVAFKATNAAAEFARDPVWKTVVESLAVTEERPQVLAGRELVAWTGPLNAHVTAACEGTESVNEALDKAQAEVTAAAEKAASG